MHISMSVKFVYILSLNWSDFIVGEKRDYKIWMDGEYTLSVIVLKSFDKSITSSSHQSHFSNFSMKKFSPSVCEKTKS